MNDIEKAASLIREAARIMPPGSGSVALAKVFNECSGEFKLSLSLIQNGIQLAHIDMSHNEALGLLQAINDAISLVWETERN